MEDRTIKINTEFNGGIFTREAGSRTILSIVKFLLFQRNQIPFLYETFKFLVTKMETADTTTEPQNFRMEKQKGFASEVLRNMSELSTFLLEESQKIRIVGARISFGATAYTIKEAYTINLPSIFCQHLYKNHSSTHQATVNRILMSLLISDDLQTVISSNLSPTNMFLEILTTSIEEELHFDRFSLKEDLDLPPKCKHVVINLINTNQHEIKNCCKRLSIYEKVKNIILNENQENSVECDSTKPVKCWEAKVVVRGFKDVLVKGQSIWDK